MLFFSWGCNKENICAKEEQDCNNLINCILVAAIDIRVKPRQLVLVRDTTEQCCELCIQIKGGSFKQFFSEDVCGSVCKSPLHDETFVLSIRLKQKRANNFITFGFYSCKLKEISRMLNVNNHVYTWISSYFICLESGKTSYLMRVINQATNYLRFMLQTTTIIIL
jgi:hypothetical protein